MCTTRVQCLLWYAATMSAVVVHQKFRHQYLVQLIKVVACGTAIIRNCHISKGKSAEKPNTAACRVQCNIRVVYNLFVSSRRIISIDGRIAEQTSRSYSMATMRKDLFYTFSVPPRSGTFRSVLSRSLHVDCYLIRNCVRCRNNVSEISTYKCHELLEERGLWIASERQI